MEIQHEQQASKGSFTAYESGKLLGEMTYSKAGPTMIIIDHTDVDEAYKGKGVGLALVMEAVAYARNNNIKILPLCPYAHSVFKKKPEIADVLR